MGNIQPDNYSQEYSKLFDKRSICNNKKNLTNLQRFSKIRNYHYENGQFLEQKKSNQQFLLLNIPIINTNDKSKNLQLKEKLQQYLKIRKHLKLQQIPQLQQIQINTSIICTTQTIIHLLFKHPSKNIQQQIISRQVMNLNFSQGQIWMILNSCLKALNYYHQNIGYHVLCNQQNIYIHKNGTIILSDAYKFTQFSAKYRYINKNGTNYQSHINQMQKMRNIGMIGARLMRVNNQINRKQQQYSQNLNNFIEMLINEEIGSFCAAIHLLQKTFLNQKQIQQQSQVFQLERSQQYEKYDNQIINQPILGLQRVQSLNYFQTYKDKKSSTHSLSSILQSQYQLKQYKSGRSNLTTASNSILNTSLYHNLHQINENSNTYQHQYHNVLKNITNQLSSNQPLKSNIINNGFVQYQMNSQFTFKLPNKSRKSSIENKQNCGNKSGTKQQKNRLTLKKGFHQQQLNQIYLKNQTNNILQQNKLNILKNKNRNSFIRRKGETNKNQQPISIQIHYDKKPELKRSQSTNFNNRNFINFNHTAPHSLLSLALNQTKQQYFSKTSIFAFNCGNQINYGQSQQFDSLSSITQSNKATSSSSGQTRTYQMIMNWDQNDHQQKNCQQSLSFKKNKNIQQKDYQLVLSQKNKIAIQFLKNRQKDVIFEVTQSDIQMSELGSRIMASRLRKSVKLSKISLLQTPKAQKSSQL